MKEHFNGREEDRGKPNVVTAEEQVNRANEYRNWLDEGNKEGGAGDPSKVHGVKRRSILHNLPYWKVIPQLHVQKFVGVEGDVASENTMFSVTSMAVFTYSVSGRGA